MQDYLQAFADWITYTVLGIFRKVRSGPPWIFSSTILSRSH